MFDNLLKLIKRNSSKTPLEDYTTEILVEILNNLPKLKRSFCSEFLNLKSEHLIISTQVKYPLKDHQNCIVDIVIKGENEICFIENKVNSKEGFKQLERYSLVLNKFLEEGYSTKLVYCTKNSDPKSITDHDFTEIKWYNIANFINEKSSEKLCNLFIDFLKQHGMVHDMNIYSKDIVALENFARVFKLMNVHLERVKNDFSSRFNNVKDARRGKTFEFQCENFNRFCIYAENVVKGEGWSEILYSFDFKGAIIVQIFISDQNPNFNEFKNYIDNSNNNSFLTEYEKDWGLRVYFEENLGRFINSETSESEIEKWFIDKFQKIEQMKIDTNNKVEWN